jgi:hypothetical protein
MLLVLQDMFIQIKSILFSNMSYLITDGINKLVENKEHWI